MKTFIAYLLKFPLYYVVLNGLVALTGLSIWWCLPIYIAILIFYTIGDDMWIMKNNYNPHMSEYFFNRVGSNLPEQTFIKAEDI